MRVMGLVPELSSFIVQDILEKVHIFITIGKTHLAISPVVVLILPSHTRMSKLVLTHNVFQVNAFLISDVHVFSLDVCNVVTTE
jgi:hypothetical protein